MIDSFSFEQMGLNSNYSTDAKTDYAGAICQALFYC